MNLVIFSTYRVSKGLYLIPGMGHGQLVFYMHSQKGTNPIGGVLVNV